MKSSDPNKNIAIPRVNDILLGRGGSSIHNQSNVRYRSMVRQYKKEYQTFTRLRKTQLAERLVQEWKDQSPPGRFLEKDEKTGLWYCIPNKSARRKTSQLLREGAPKIRVQLKNESTQRKLEASSPQVMFMTPEPIMRPSEQEAEYVMSPGISAAESAAAVDSPDRTNQNSPTTVPTTPIKLSLTTRTLLGDHASSRPPSSSQRIFYPEFNSNNFLMSPVPSHHQHHHHQYHPYPSTASPSSQHYMTPQRWQPYQPSMSSPVPLPTTPRPAPFPTTTALRPPPMQALPLKPITPADVNQNLPLTRNKKLHKPAAVSRSNSCGSVNSKGFSKSNYYKPKAPSPESVLDFDSLGELPPPSWDSSDILGENSDILASLVVDLSSVTDDAGAPRAIWERTTLEPLQENEEMCPGIPLHDVPVSPLRFREESTSSSSSQPFLLDMPHSFSFSSWEDSGGERSSFDMMEKVVRAESDLDHTRVCDILNELDKELENEFMMPCHSF